MSPKITPVCCGQLGHDYISDITNILLPRYEISRGGGISPHQVLDVIILPFFVI